MTSTVMQQKSDEQRSARRRLFEGFTLEGFGWLLAIVAIIFAVWGYIDQYGTAWTISN
ncbi:MAG: hypothetical protein AAFR81_21365 [Chloroflexota bacterium]